MKVGLAGSRSETKVVGGWTPRSDNAVLEDVAVAVAVAVVEVTADDVAEVEEGNRVDEEGNRVDEVVWVIEASADDEKSGIDELVAVIGLSSGAETAGVEAMEVASTGEAELTESKNSTWVKN